LCAITQLPTLGSEKPKGTNLASRMNNNLLKDIFVYSKTPNPEELLILPKIATTMVQLLSKLEN
jgi:hypothetical protein